MGEEIEIGVRQTGLILLYCLAIQKYRFHILSEVDDVRIRLDGDQGHEP